MGFFMSVTRSQNDHVLKILEELENRVIKIGIPDTAHYTNGTPVAYVAAIQEFGYGPIPPRPFFRPAIADNKDKWSNLVSSGVGAALRGAIQLDDALAQVGMVGAGDVQNAIKAVQTPALKASTIRNRRTRKNRNKNQSVKPLVDTGQLIQSVTSIVEKT